MGIDEIGFSEHIDFLPECGSYDYVDFAAYIKRVKALQAEGFKVFAGAEIDYVSEARNDIAEHLKLYHYDYTISSVHMINHTSVSDGKIKSFADMSSLKWFLICYYAEVKDSLTMPGITVLGHMGIYKRQMWQFIVQEKQAVELINELEGEIAQLCVKLGIIVEVNASALFSGYKSPLADEAFLEQYYIAGGKKVTVGSDAHKAENLYRGVDECISLLKSIGFTELITPWNGKTILI
jgi:histidinol-phosphatase (PHP family)